MQKNPAIIQLYNNHLIGNLASKIRLLLFFLLVMQVSSCSNDQYLYDRPGFEAGGVPQQTQGIEGQNRVAPDYYYRQQGGAYPYQGGQPNYQYPPVQYPNQGYQPNMQYGSPYQVYPSAGSRYYSNPYAIPPSPYYPQYDADQYYVPPAYYGIENQQNSMQKPNSGGKAY